MADGLYHTVAAGDSLVLLAELYYGRSGDWDHIYYANMDAVGDDPEVLTPGATLFIPALETADGEAFLKEGVVPRRETVGPKGAAFRKRQARKVAGREKWLYAGVPAHAGTVWRYERMVAARIARESAVAVTANVGRDLESVDPVPAPAADERLVPYAGYPASRFHDASVPPDRPYRGEPVPGTRTPPAASAPFPDVNLKLKKMPLVANLLRVMVESYYGTYCVAYYARALAANGLDPAKAALLPGTAVKLPARLSAAAQREAEGWRALLLEGKGAA